MQFAGIEGFWVFDMIVSNCFSMEWKYVNKRMLSKK